MNQKQKEWKISYSRPELPEELLQSGFPPLLAAVLAQRGIRSCKAAEELFFGGEVLYDPMLMTGMAVAVDRIKQAIARGETVAVYGDYDVDGITSTCLLTDYLRSKGLRCLPYIPDRNEEGYGLNDGPVDALRARGASLLITVDCGITALSEVEHAAQIGLEVIITDHHECKEKLPAAAAVVNPRRVDSEYPFRELAGDRFLVSYLGNMGTSQDMQTVLEAIRILKEDTSIFFLFAGHGNKLEKLKKIAQEERLENFCVRGYLTEQEYTDALVASDCALVTLNPGVTGLCVPSKTYGYMMAGLPLLVVMDDSDIARDAASGAGVRIGDCDGGAMAEAIRAMRDDPERTARMGKTSRALFLENYTLPICTGKYVDMFRGLLPGAGK